MALKQQLNVKQGQSLVMTPQMQMAVKLLHMTNLELKDMLEKELEENPLLTREEEEIEAKQALEKESDLNFEKEEPQQELDTSYENVWADVSTSSSKAGGDIDFDQFIETTQTLQDYLYEQFIQEHQDPHQKAIGYYLIHSLSEAGYLEQDLNEIAELLGVELQDVEAALSLLHTLEPYGIAARNLQECLFIQLVAHTKLTPQKEILLNNLDLIARRDFKALSALTDFNEDLLKDAIRDIQSLNPRPGHGFNHASPQTLIPDVYVRAHEGGWRVDLNSETLPRALADKSYYAEVKTHLKDKSDKEYLAEQWNHANWLIKAVHQRANTILKVSSEIIKQQEDFFRYGIRHLKPLTLRDIAQSIEMHESTISRVTANKYMSTPRGTFELRFFFTTAIHSNTGGESHSSTLVRQRIQTLIEKEPSQKPLSDGKLVKSLAEEGIEVARRTVTKYREALKIPSSFQRKRLKAI